MTTIHTRFVIFLDSGLKIAGMTRGDGFRLLVAALPGRKDAMLFFVFSPASLEIAEDAEKKFGKNNSVHSVDSVREIPLARFA